MKWLTRLIFPLQGNSSLSLSLSLEGLTAAARPCIEMKILKFTPLYQWTVPTHLKPVPVNLVPIKQQTT